MKSVKCLAQSLEEADFPDYQRGVTTPLSHIPFLGKVRKSLEWKKKKTNTSTALISELFPPPRLVTRGILQTGPVVHLAESQTPESIQVDTRTHALLLILAQVITNSLPIFLSQSCESISQFQMDSWPKVAAAIKGVFAIETSGQGTGVSRMNPTTRFW